MFCKYCGISLSTSIRKNGYKSCPSCSQSSSQQEHIFYPENEFGFTSLRVTSNNPDGIQSWCSSCRGWGTNSSLGIPCSKMK